MIEDYDNQGIGLEAIPYEQYFRQRGVRMYNFFLHPRFSPQDKFELPRSPLVHYIPQTKTEIGITPSHLFLQRAPGLIASTHIDELATKEGGVVRNAQPVLPLINNYRQQYRKIRPLLKLESGLRDERSIIVINYGVLAHIYRYPKLPLSRAWEFKNQLETLVATVNDIATKTTRQQYIELTIPKNIPTRPQFIRGASQGVNRETLKVFTDNSSLFLLELWLWLSQARGRSILNKLSNEALSKLNFVVFEGGYFTLFNLGLLDSWRADPKDLNPDGTLKSAAQMQLGFLKFLEAIYAARTAVSKTTMDTVVTRTTSDDSPDSELASDEEVVSITLSDAETRELEELEQASLQVDETEIDYETSNDEDLDVVTTIQPIVENDDLPNAPEDTGDAPKAAGVVERAEALREDGIISQAELQRYQRLGAAYKNIPNPFGAGTLEDAAAIDPETINNIEPAGIPDIPNVIDKSMLNSTLVNFDAQYIEKVLHADIVNMVLGAQNAGVAITGYSVQTVVDANNAYEIHSVQLTPVGGAPTTFRFKLPIVNKDGTYKNAGIKYRLRKQRADMPIRKINPTKVGLTSYYSKLMVNRSTRKVNCYKTWLLNQVTLLIETKKEILVSSWGNFFTPKIRVPRPMSVLASKFKGFTYNDYEFVFDIAQLLEKYGKDTILKLAGQKEMIIGTKEGKPIHMVESGYIYIPGEETVLGTIEDILSIDAAKAPVEIVEVDVMGKAIPIAMILGQHYGISNLLRMLKVEHRLVERGTRLNLNKSEYPIRFADFSLVINREQRLASLIIGSFNSFSKSLELYDYAEFDDKVVYSAIYERQELGVRYYREVELMFQMYIDHITKDLLEQMKEPTEFGPLLVRAAQLLINDDHPKETSDKLIRERGYERMAGLVYAEMIRGIRQYKAKPVTAKSKVEIHPGAVWTALQEDTSVSIIEESNPIQNLKEQENLTYSGTGGRSSRTMVRRNREYNEEAIGRISEATVDSSDVAVTVYYSANPRVANLRGVMAEGEADLEETSSLLSTSALLSPCADRDDPKRVNFISIQQAHVVACKGYTSAPVRTGYEMIMAHRNGDLFSYVAKGPGVVKLVKADVAEFVYDDPDLGQDNVEIGRSYGVATGKTIPHDIVCDVPVGTRFNKGDVLCFNSGFFERDLMTPTQVNWLSGVMCRVVVMDSPDTLEDSSAISPRLADELEINTSYVRDLEVRFDQGIHNLVAVGDYVDVDSVLCTIEDASTAGDYDFGDDGLDSLRMMARNSPASKYAGKIGRIEILYNGDLEDMTESLRTVVNYYDHQRYVRAKKLNDSKIAVHGNVADLDVDTVKINIYIDSTNGTGDGDKAVLSHQLKTVIRRVMVGENKTKAGEPIDLIFGATSIDARLVNSVYILGTTNTLVVERGKRAAKAYREAE